jgi:hypothetical protein
VLWSLTADDRKDAPRNLKRLDAASCYTLALCWVWWLVWRFLGQEFFCSDHHFSLTMEKMAAESWNGEDRKLRAVVGSTGKEGICEIYWSRRYGIRRRVSSYRSLPGLSTRGCKSYATSVTSSSRSGLLDDHCLDLLRSTLSWLGGVFHRFSHYFVGPRCPSVQDGRWKRKERNSRGGRAMAGLARYWTSHWHQLTPQKLQPRVLAHFYHCHRTYSVEALALASLVHVRVVLCVGLIICKASPILRLSCS